MATDFQTEFVSDIEAAVSALSSQGKKPKDVKIAEICEMAGHELGDLSPVVKRLAGKGEVDLLHRLDAAFQRLGIVQKTLQRELQKIHSGELGLKDRDDETETDRLVLEPVIPPAPETVVQHAQMHRSGHSHQNSDRFHLDRVLAILETLPKKSQRRLLNSAAEFLEVGE